GGDRTERDAPADAVAAVRLGRGGRRGRVPGEVRDAPLGVRRRGGGGGGQGRPAEQGQRSAAATTRAGPGGGGGGGGRSGGGEGKSGRRVEGNGGLPGDTDHNAPRARAICPPGGRGS